jgi:hypothetical protein
MGDMGDDFRWWKEQDKIRKAKNLTNADPQGWLQHTEYHWSRQLNGKRLDYWPSRNKFMYEGKVMTGGIQGFIAKREKLEPQSDSGECLSCVGGKCTAGPECVACSNPPYPTPLPSLLDPEATDPNKEPW